MKVLLVHNTYQQKGGEDAVVLSERNLLLEHGVDVELLLENNDAIQGLSSKIAAAGSVFYSPKGVGKVNEAIGRFEPDIIHVHNWFPTLSPGIFWSARKQGLAVIQTLHNYRLLCANGALFRNGTVCEDCVGTHLRSPGVIHACYRGSRAGTAVATAGMLTHWKIGTWHRAVDRFIALSEFARGKMIEGGLLADKIVVKPNFLDRDPGFRRGNLGYFAFVGRLSEEKGVSTLLECWKQNPDLPLLRIVGVGPLESRVQEAAAMLNNVEWMGSRSGDQVLDIMGGALALLCPSLWYEGMPRVVIEALGVGTPVIASRLGTYLEMIEGGTFGELFPANDVNALAGCLRRLLAEDAFPAMRAAARREFEQNYSGSKNFAMLHQIYESALTQRRMT